MVDRDDDDRRRIRPVPGVGDWGQSSGAASAGGSVGGTGGGKALGDSGIGHVAGQSMGGTGGGKAMGDFGGAKALGDTGVGHTAGQPLGYTGGGKAFNSTGFEQPGHSGMAHTAGGVSTKGVLIAGATTVAVGAAAVAAFLALRPDDSRTNAEEAQQRSSEVGTNPVAGGAPGGGTGGDAVVRGTYQSRNTVTSGASSATNDNTVVATSDCARCDVTFSGPGSSNTYHWNGDVLELITTDAICPGDRVTFTPTAFADGYVQQMSHYYLTCNGTLSQGTLTRIGD